MLVLSRKIGEKIVIGGDIVVTLVDVRGDKCRLGLEAPRQTPIRRQEIWEAIHGGKSCPGSSQSESPS